MSSVAARTSRLATCTVALSIVDVEDNEGGALFLREAFEMANSNVQLIVIPDGARALRYFKMKATAKDAPPLHMILLDMHLPLVDGCESLAFIKSNPALKGIPHLLFAREGACASLHRDLGLAPESCVQKAQDWDGLMQLVQHIISLVSNAGR